MKYCQICGKTSIKLNDIDFFGMKIKACKECEILNEFYIERRKKIMKIFNSAKEEIILILNEIYNNIELKLKDAFIKQRRKDE